MSTRTLAPLLSVVLLACDSEDGATDADIAALSEQIAALETGQEEQSAVNAALWEAIEELQSENTSLRDELAALTGGVDLTELADSVADNTDDLALQAADLTAAEAAISANAGDISASTATLTDLSGRLDTVESDYLTASDLAGYATASDLSAAIAGVDHSSYLTASDLAGYASESWVLAKGYSTDTVDPELTDLLSYLTVDTGADEIVLSGANLLLQSGSGATNDNGSLLGLGNLIIGYDTDDGSDTKTGSHNLVVGDEHTYTKYGGIIAGENNGLTGISGVVGGYANTASGSYSTVIGGRSNTASGTYASIGGGRDNLASSYYSVVSGGYINTAAGNYSAVSGGRLNTASGQYSSASGGYANTASGQYSAVYGDSYQLASSTYSYAP